MRSVLSLVLLAACLVSALSVIWIRQENRVLTPQLHARYEMRDDLNITWRELLAEQSTHSRLESVKDWSESTGNLAAPEKEVVVIVKRNPYDWQLLEGWQ